MSFGNHLKKIRLASELTQDELAKKINTSRSNIANYENDKNMPSVEMLDKLSEVLNCSIDYLLGKTDIRNPEKEKQLKKDILDLEKMGFSLDKYVPPTEQQEEDIKALLEVFLKNNKKEDKEDK